ncbi:MAG: 50S ribosomal protein L15 [Candidatus Scalindua sp.]|jgi:large subunit ribosomal protein L15|nr:50S ribosomal protein L15 [Candidatus Scalindua sp.]MBT5305822.1 50S ribosomal protein L15 [Candidatus Scalindua sp.]MBT6050974.1 50S ribosomal protein L15 [Candidatus Scalindua sp.]MBT6561363.1 50S ribosomal protein L15 [Candidatus Scalindua sp.]MBT7212393.1 50S ribosomal protein L15 [Candidatus Scalindua sp.]
MNLIDAKKSLQKIKKRKRVGRGAGSGHGKTSCKGFKGQKSRSGNKLRTIFEGGQMPLFRRIPKRGFTNPFKKKYTILNIKDFENFDSGTSVDLQSLKECGLIKSLKYDLKVLGEGVLTKSLTIAAHKFSGVAIAKIKEAGGEAVAIS